MVNAFELRGYPVFPTNGMTLMDSDGSSRPGWTSANPLGFVDDSAETDEDT